MKDDRLWIQIAENALSEESVNANYENFKSSVVNYQLCMWTEGNYWRYIVNLAYNLLYEMPEGTRDKLRNVKNREIGKPYQVTYEGLTACLDYIQAVFELEFLESNFVFNDRHIIEIGAGYGRTCHTIMSNHDVAEYTIVDLGCTLRLAKRYLKDVLEPDQYAKINFAEKPLKGKYDLAIMIDMAGEISDNALLDYLKFIDDNCYSFYIKNPVGLYVGISPGKADEYFTRRQILINDYFSNKYESFSDSELIEVRADYFLGKASPGDEWRLVDNSWARPFSHYWQAFYNKVSA